MKKVVSPEYWLLFAIIFGCGTKEAVKAPVLELPVVRVLEQDVPLTVEFVGQTYGASDIAIRARVEGFLEGIHFEEGSRVTKGQLLYTIDPAQFQAQVAAAQSKVVEAQTILVKAQSDLGRIKPLAEINAVSESDLDAAVAQKGASEASVEAAKAELQYANITLGYSRVYSPLDGIIGRTEARIGDFVGRYPNPVVLNTVSRINVILVRFSIPEASYLRLARYYGMEEQQRRQEEGSKADLELKLADGTVHNHHGIVDFIDREVDPTTGSLLVQASFPNPESVLRPGQFARVKVTLDEIKGGLLIPQRCVREIQGIYEVFVVNDSSKIESRLIKLGPKIGNMWSVLEGLDKNDMLVLEGIQRVRSGTLIKPQIQEFEFISSN